MRGNIISLIIKAYSTECIHGVTFYAYFHCQEEFIINGPPQSGKSATLRRG